MLAEPHIAIVDANVRRKGTAEIANEYVRFLYTSEAQELIAKNFNRPTNPAVFARHKSLFPEMDLKPSDNTRFIREMGRHPKEILRGGTAIRSDSSCREIEGVKVSVFDGKEVIVLMSPFCFLRLVGVDRIESLQDFMRKGTPASP